MGIHYLTSNIDDGVAIIEMIDGENRFKLTFVDAWHQALDKILKNKDVRCLVSVGTGDIYSNGMDLKWLVDSDAECIQQFMSRMHELFLRLLTFPIPTVAVLNGHSFGAGAVLALVHDYRIMRQDRGWLCWPEVALGLPFHPILTDIFRAKLSPGSVQRDAVLFCKRFSGEDAKRCRLVDALSTKDKLLDEGIKLVQSSLEKNKLQRDILEAMKKDLYRGVIKSAKL